MSESADALCDGGDVLFTGREIFVGLSRRTNEAGVLSLQKAFPQYPVNAVRIHGPLHLKSVASCVGDALIFADTIPGTHSPQTPVVMATDAARCRQAGDGAD